MASQHVYPRLALREYVSAYILSDYTCDGFVDDTTCIYPEGSAILCFSLDDPFIFKEVSTGNIIRFTRFNFIPQFKQPRFYKVIACPSKVLHVIFKPYGAYKLLGIPQNGSFDKHGTSLFDMPAGKTMALLNRIEDAAHNSTLIIHIVNEWLEDQLVKHDKIDVRRVSRACKLIEVSKGMLPIEQLSQKMQLSKRTLEYQFQEQVGLSPKLYSRITRFSSLIATIKKDKITDWQELLFKYNYFDQAHFINDFKYFSGAPPSRLKDIRPILTASAL